MAAKKRPASAKATPAAKTASSKAADGAKTTPVRYSAIPKVTETTPRNKEVSHVTIAVRAYEIWLSGQGGSECENWLQAERELRGR